jgi:hypothetical protein
MVETSVDAVTPRTRLPLRLPLELVLLAPAIGAIMHRAYHYALPYWLAFCFGPVISATCVDAVAAVASAASRMRRDVMLVLGNFHRPKSTKELP